MDPGRATPATTHIHLALNRPHDQFSDASKHKPQAQHAVQGIWRVAVYNPMRTYPLAFNLTVAKHANCLNNCSSHGACSEVSDSLCAPPQVS